MKMGNTYNLRAALLTGVATLVLGAAQGAYAQDAQTKDTAATPGTSQEADTVVVVTGSRVATGAKAPTPVTSLTTDALSQNTPTNIPDGLNKLPVFAGSFNPRRPFPGNDVQAGNVLALRSFGAQRTLVLLDGHRVTPANPNGTVTPDVLPQMLVSRVDVVTGGASAVYGSDAVTGVVNFVLDKKFSGFKFDVQAGVSDYGDAASHKFGLAWGKDVFNGRGHLIASFEEYKTDPVSNMDRPYGKDVYVLTGTGSAANPYTPTANVRRTDSSFGGRIDAVAGCASPCSLTSMQFLPGGVLGAYNAGTATGTGNNSVGGDGAYSPYSTALVGLKTDQAFLRYSQDLTDDISFYFQGSYAKAEAVGTHFVVKLIPNAGSLTLTNTNGATYFKNNAFLPDATQTALGNNGLNDASNLFSMGEYVAGLGSKNQYAGRNVNENTNFASGLTGNFGRFKWDLYLSHGKNEQTTWALNNSNQQKQFAAMDAVKDSNGKIVCYASTQAATAAAYANCVPTNAFGQGSVTQEMFDYFTTDTASTVTNQLDNIEASIAGDLFTGWAGPITGSLSAEFRRNSYRVTSDTPQGLVDCTGLRICNPNATLYYGDVPANARASNSVWDISAEANVPILADVAVAKSLTLNLAARHTEYSTSGPVWTWKVGAVWDLNGQVRFRGAKSVDIRAPTLDDLFRPVSTGVIGYNDLHTNTNLTALMVTTGNPDLKPEKADTETFGVVVRPDFLPGFTTSLDFYHIKLANAISQLTATDNSVQQLCEDAGGTGPYCSLYVRPLPWSDRTSANFPTSIKTQKVNAAVAEVEGYDFEASYLRGPLSLRFFANYQPINTNQAFAAAPVLKVAASKIRATTMVSYTVHGVKLGLQDNWYSSYDQAVATPTATSNNYVVPTIKAFNTVDLSAETDIKAWGKPVTAFASIQNATNAIAPLAPVSGSVGIIYPTTLGYDIMGRYFTVGLRGKF